MYNLNQTGLPPFQNGTGLDHHVYFVKFCRAPFFQNAFEQLILLNEIEQIKAIIHHYSLQTPSTKTLCHNW